MNKEMAQTPSSRWKHTKPDWERLLHGFNPWHATGEVPHAFAPATERSLASVLWRELVAPNDRRHRLLIGPRRVGKTTVLYQTVRHLIESGIPQRRVWWLQLEHPALQDRPLDELVQAAINASGAVHDQPVYLLLDEVGYSRLGEGGWARWLKVMYDQHWPIRVAATSSSAAELHTGRHDDLTGRSVEHIMLPCTLPEAMELAGVPFAPPPRGGSLRESIELAARERWVASPECEALARRLLLCGGLPDLIKRYAGSDMSDVDAAAGAGLSLREDLIKRAIFRDLTASRPLQDPARLERLFTLLAAQTGGLLSPANLASDLGVTAATVDRWMPYLERDAMLVFTLSCLGTGAGARRGRKLYLTDPALRGAALWRGAEVLNNPPELGPLLENQAASHLLAAARAASADGQLHYWREGNKREVDLVWNHESGRLAFEIATSDSHKRSGAAAFLAAHREFTGGAYLVAKDCTASLPADSVNGVGQIPLATLLMVCGMHAAGARAPQRLQTSNDAAQLSDAGRPPMEEPMGSARPLHEMFCEQLAAFEVRQQIGVKNRRALGRSTRQAGTSATPESGSVDDLMARAYACFEKRDFAGAIADYTSAIELTPKLAGAYLGRCLMRIMSGDAAGAISDGTRAQELDPTMPEARLLCGAARYDSQDYIGAITEFTKAVEIDPQRASSYLSRARARLQSNDNPGAIADLTKTLELDPGLAFAFYYRGLARRAAKHDSDAVADFTKALELDPSMEAAYISRGSARDDLNDSIGAIADYTKLVELDPKNVNAFIWRGHSRAALGDHPGAVADFSKALELNPGKASVYHSRGLMRRMIGDYASAVSDAVQAVTLEPHDERYQRGLANAVRERDAATKKQNSS